MSKKAIVILIIALIAVVAATSVGVAYVVKTDNAGLALDGVGDEFNAAAEITDMLPGQSSVNEYSAKAPAGAVFTISLSGGRSTDLSRYVDVTIAVNGRELFSGNYLSCKGVIYTAEVSGEFTFSVTYALPEEVGNNAQGKECSIKVHCTLQEKVGG